MRWRSKFGRPSSVPPLGADPTGTYCEIPQDWLEKKVAEKRKPVKPTGAELWQLGVFNSFPFIGFGFLDNFIMIMAGDYIDLTIGATLGISTLAAAALGNTISDLAGIGSAWYVENIAAKIGVKPPNLSKEQMQLSSSTWSANIGRGIGVVLGCIFGMFPLLFLPLHDESEITTKKRTTTEKSKEDLQ
ncbi:transmembrane protein 65 isoform X2 [Oratosquilla oratoria]